MTDSIFYAGDNIGHLPSRISTATGRVVVRSVALGVLLSVLSSCALHAAEVTSIPWRENVVQLQKDQTQARKPVLLYITAPGCAYCVKMKSDTFSHHDVVAKVAKKFTAVKVDGRKHAAVSQRLKVKVYPTTAIVHPSGAVVDMIPGYLGPQDFLRRLADAEVKLDYQTKLLAAKPRTATVK